ncbi:MAG TPA: hypothetical protein ENN19_11290 [Chloroflexi bacterium]|nr:hypothetical protein [Chloroflexota bacterium]
MRSLNVTFIVRGGLLALLTALLVGGAGLALIISRTPVGQAPDPTPPPPTILASRAPLPPGPVGLRALVTYGEESPRLAGSGFLLALESGDVVGVMASHSIALGNAARLPERVTLRVAGQADQALVFDTLWGPPGRPDGTLAMDCVLLRPAGPVDPVWVLTPDPRGAPQPGERVTLFSGLGDGDGGRRMLAGTVQSVGESGAWMLMDASFNPAMMSGSPVLSQHTGQVVGMALAAAPRRWRLLIGMNPIRHIVRQAEAASEFPTLIEYRWPVSSQ